MLLRLFKRVLTLFRHLDCPIAFFLSRPVTRDLSESSPGGHTRASHPGDLLVPSGSARLRDSSEDLALDTQLTQFCLAVSSGRLPRACHTSHLALLMESNAPGLGALLGPSVPCLQSANSELRVISWKLLQAFHLILSVFIVLLAGTHGPAIWAQLASG